MKEKIAILKSSLTKDLKKINGLSRKFDSAYEWYLNSEEYSKLVESAFYVSQLYSGYEKIFQDVAKTFENNIEQDYWHKSILERMSLEIADIRPALISEESLECLNELRAFRHFFRHAYDADINDEKFRIIATSVSTLKKTIREDLKKFLLFLDAILKS